MTSFQSQNEQELDYPQKQAKLKLEPTMTPLALMYLLSIYNGDFDKRLHMGHFVTNTQFGQRVRDLINMNLIGYDGQHFIKPKGSQYVADLLEMKP